MLITGSTAAAAASASLASGGAKSMPTLTPAALEVLEKEVARLTAALSSLKSKRTAAQAELKALTSLLPKLTSRASKLALEKIALEAIVEDVEAQVKVAAVAAGVKGRAGAEEEAAELASLTLASQAAAARAATTAAAASAQQSLITSTQRRLVESGGERVARVEARLARAREDFEATSKELVKARNTLKTQEKAVEKVRLGVEKKVWGGGGGWASTYTY